VSVDFEARYRRDPDPWGYETRPYEQAKYTATLEACGRGRYARGLELGASIGVFSARLAPRCDELVTIDLAPTAVAAARGRLRDYVGVDVIHGVVPDAVPDGPFDLVVASEVLYYLAPAALEDTLDRIAAVAEPGARIVAVHWRPGGPERPFTAAEVHAALQARPELCPIETGGTDDYLLDVLERR
jgi:SAM-dependent methyltransferase